MRDSHDSWSTSWSRRLPCLYLPSRIGGLFHVSRLSLYCVSLSSLFLVLSPSNVTSNVTWPLHEVIHLFSVCPIYDLRDWKNRRLTRPQSSRNLGHPILRLLWFRSRYTVDIASAASATSTAVTTCFASRSLSAYQHIQIEHWVESNPLELLITIVALCCLKHLPHLDQRHMWKLDVLDR